MLLNKLHLYGMDDAAVKLRESLISYAKKDYFTEFQNNVLFAKLLFMWTVTTINVLFYSVLF